jgi:hypothetical protein
MSTTYTIWTSPESYVYELSRNTWHGYMRPAGTPISLTSGKDMSTTDEHGCGTFWCLDSAGDKMNVWECELVLRGWNQL